MKNIYLSIIKNFMYLYLAVTIVYIVILVMVGYINYDNRFIGCEGGQCSVLFSFVDEEDQKEAAIVNDKDSDRAYTCLLYTSPSPRDRTRSRMPSSA